MSEVSDLILRRTGLAHVPAGHTRGEDRLVQAAELELAALGYVCSYALRDRLLTLEPDALAHTTAALCAALAANLGADQQHVPLFRKFPNGVPEDTQALWIQKVLVHYYQEPDQPCLLCARSGTTNVLRPCMHVVCERCFDGANLSACPICEHHVEKDAPFFRPLDTPRGQSPAEIIRFKRLDLAEHLEDAARTLFLSLCARPQAMSPDDVAALLTLARAYADTLLRWLPPEIPVRENVAHLFGTLLRRRAEPEILRAARPYLKSATDLLRVLAVFSGAAPALQKQRMALGRGAPSGTKVTVVQTERFKLGRMSRPLRRALLALLDAFPRDALVEDMLRHAALWAWVGEFAHPFEHARRHPNAALGFALVRGSEAEALTRAGVPLPPLGGESPYELDARGRLRFCSFYARMERLLRARDAGGLVRLLRARPGELGRRIDLLLRLEAPAGTDGALRALEARVADLNTPMLLTLGATLANRERPLSERVFFPKGAHFVAPSARDTRAPIPAAITERATATLDAELLRRLGEKPRFEQAILDSGLRRIRVPSNERTASPAAVNLPRGSVVPTPVGRWLRLFLHWCQPDRPNTTTDIDLSVGFYGERWEYRDVCSYYSLNLRHEGRPIARSSGDLRDAPFPQGASEFIDLDRQLALDAGLRYAVMVVNNYAGLGFSALERGFAGVMAREDAQGAHFDARTVALRFNLTGDNGVYMPLVLDLAKNELFWLDATSKGSFAFNNVERSNRTITRICPETMRYYASGARPDLFRLAAAHAAARCDQVSVRDGRVVLLYRRQVGESALDLYRRLLSDEPDGVEEALPERVVPVFAALMHGDLDLPPDSVVYALFREQVVAPIAASDLLS